MLIFTALNTHETYMQRCLDLAKKGFGNVAPNPMVGSVLVYQGEIIGEGFHEQYGMPHAEVNCINSVTPENRHLINKSTLYVSLEPCNHFGKTPPCTDLISTNKIPEVVIACKDSFEKVNGAGIKKLSENGIKIITGILQNQAVELNKRFFIFHQQKRPYIILKWAQSSDGFIAMADGQPLKISNDLTNKLVHRWRSEESAIIVGTRTVVNDNPALTNRLWSGNNPVRIIIDKKLKIDASYHILDNSTPTIIFNEIKNVQEGRNEYIMLENETPFHHQLFKVLCQKGLQSLIVEGGTVLLESFLSANLWDELRVITNTKLKLNQGIKAPEIGRLNFTRKEAIRNDEINYYTRST